jgi:ribosome biogenesis GTPase / thiamine phosphate phosphatase
VKKFTLNEKRSVAMAEGKIIKALSGFYYVKSNDTIFQCRGRGVFRKNNITPLVGDNVVFTAENDREGYIMEIKERENELVRPPIANVDQAILIFSAKDPEFSPHLLDRFLVIIESYQIKPIIVITKIDLANSDELLNIKQYAKAYEKIGYDVLLTSSKNEIGLEDIYLLLENKITVFAGQSGVGKSSLLNALQPELNLETKAISKHLGRGKHTTRHVELLEIGDGLVADTPGFSSLDFSNIEAEELTYCYPEMKERFANCKFRGCLHDKEPHCAIKEAVETGEIEEFRYNHYLLFLKEIQQRKPRY